MRDRRDTRYYRHMEKLKKREAEGQAQRNSPRINLNFFWLALFFIAEKSLLLLADPPGKEDIGFDILTYLVLAGCGIYYLVKYFRTRKAEAAKTDDYAARKARDYRSNLWLWIPISLFCLAMIIIDALTDYTPKIIGGMSVLLAVALFFTYINLKNYCKAKQEFNKRKEEDA